MMVSHPVALMTGCLVFSYDRSGWLTGRTGQMYDHDHYYYDKA
ncbi:hypothetical protein A1SC_03956, partial [Escherichia sp. KTE52]